MGGSESNEQDELSSTDPFTESEIKKLKDLHSALKQNLDTLIPSSVLAEGIRQGNILADLARFKSFVIDNTRTNKSTIMLSNWNLVAAVSSCDSSTLATSSETESGSDGLRNFFRMILQLLKCSEVEVEKLSVLLSVHVTEMKQSTNNLAYSSTFDQLIYWMRLYAPCLPNILETFYNYFFFNDMSGAPFNEFRLAKLNTISEIVSRAELIPLAMYHNKLQGNWRILYTTSKDGLSFNRIAYHILGFEGPTCLLIKCHPIGGDGSGMPHVIGAFSHDSWKDSNRHYGSSQNCLFTLRPNIRILRSRDNSAGDYQWLNTSTYGQAHGLGFGGSGTRGDWDSFRLWIPDTLENCVVRSNCLTYEPGSLLTRTAEVKGATTDGHCEFDATTSPTKVSSPFACRNEVYFEIDCIEIYGCGGDETLAYGLKAQQEARKTKDEHIQRARKVDKAQFFNNPFDREFLLGGTFEQDCNGQKGAHDS